MREDNQNADPNSTCGVLQNVEDGFYFCPAYGFSTGITPYIQNVPDIWSFGRQFGSRNMAGWMRNFPLAREAPYPKLARLPTYQYECECHGADYFYGQVDET